MRAFDYSDISYINAGRSLRQKTVDYVQIDLANYATSLGQTRTQIEDKLDTLFNTFASEWSIYLLVGATGIIDAIQNDVTIPWLDTDISGTTIRQRLINRLS